MVLTATATATAEPDSTDQTEDETYAYSFDRTQWRGRFASRRAAVRAARAALPNWPAMAEAIYVGRQIEPAAHVAGHAEIVLEAMRDEALDAGDDPVGYDGLPHGAREDLDARLAQALREWLDAHDLAGESRIEEISEHALPLVEHVGGRAELRDQVEVGTIGIEG